MVRVNPNPGWKQIESETLTLSAAKAKELARKHAAMPRSPTERDLDDKRLDHLNRILANGQAVAFNWAIVRFDGKNYRMNGQHSSQAILQFDGDLPGSLVFHVDRYDAPSREALADLFQQFDARWSSRSKGDVAGAYQGLDPELSGCDKANAKVAIDGIAWYLRSPGGIAGVPTGDSVYELFFEEKYHPFIIWLSGFLSSKTPEIKPAGIVAAIYATFVTASDENAVKDFWESVAAVRQEDEASAVKVLAEALLKSFEVKSKNDKMGPKEAYCKCVRAWNAHRAGDRITKLAYYPTKGYPEVSR
jgi:hypothetical protein